jgi:hypothetical protein
VGPDVDEGLTLERGADRRREPIGVDGDLFGGEHRVDRPAAGVGTVVATALTLDAPVQRSTHVPGVGTDRFARARHRRGGTVDDRDALAARRQRQCET